jgi:hypothetical protein
MLEELRREVKKNSDKEKRILYLNMRGSLKI